MTIPLSRPQTMKFQLAPCHRPVTNQRMMLHVWTEIRLPNRPKRFRHLWWSFKIGLDTDMG